MTVAWTLNDRRPNLMVMTTPQENDQLDTWRGRVRNGLDPNVEAANLGMAPTQTGAGDWQATLVNGHHVIYDLNNQTLTIHSITL